VLIAAQRSGPVRAVPIDRETVAHMQPVIDHHIDKDSHLMSDEHRSYMCMGKQFSAHSHVNHSKREYSRGDVHNNTAESFNSNFKRALIGVFHYISDKHLSRYLHELGFRWENRVEDKKRTKTGKYKTVMKPIPTIDMLVILIMRLSGIRLRRTKAWGIEDFPLNLAFKL
jgi:transposase-like protein